MWRHRQLGTQPADCVALEDSVTGVTSAAAAGMLVIGVPYLPNTELPGCDVLAASLADPVVAGTLGLG